MVFYYFPQALDITINSLQVGPFASDYGGQHNRHRGSAEWEYIAGACHFAATRSWLFRSTKQSATTELDMKQKASFNHCSEASELQFLKLAVTGCPSVCE